MKQYYVKYWGQASDFLKEKLNVSELDFWFDSQISLNKHIDYVERLCKDVGTIVHRSEQGEDLEYKTVVEMKLVYKGKSYPYQHDFGYGYPCISAEFMFFEGNLSCDCNLSSCIQEVSDDFPELDCGDEIKIEDFKITKVKGERFK